MPGDGLVTVQLPLAAKLTAKPEVADALTPKSGSPKVLFAKTPNVIVWLAFKLVRAKLAVPVMPLPVAATLYGPPAVALAIADELA